MNDKEDPKAFNQALLLLMLAMLIMAVAAVITG